MGIATDGQGRERRTLRVAHRRDLTYQFPVYRWLSWLVVAGFAAGLGLMYLLAGMFGIPAPLGWAFLGRRDWRLGWTIGLSLVGRFRAGDDRYGDFPLHH